ncbi:MAG: sortase [Candidatus Levybacteria bacterium]|nr:sortase [Candidatus Levybacteria bacterium]
MKNKKSFLYYLGNFLIITSIASLLFIYYPFIQIYLFPPKIQSTITAKGYFIQIPKINAEAPIILNVDPWNENIYRQKLKKGVAHAKTTSPPGEKGVSYLFAHSSDNPWSIGRYNTIFFRLGELNINDEIFVFKDGKKNVYRVKGKKIIWPDQVEYLKQKTQKYSSSPSTNAQGRLESRSKSLEKDKNEVSRLILQTCYPIGTAFQRLLIFAEST